MVSRFALFFVFLLGREKSLQTAAEEIPRRGRMENLIEAALPQPTRRARANRVQRKAFGRVARKRFLVCR